MSFETHNDLFKEQTKAMLLKTLAELSDEAPTSDEWGNELCYPNWRNVDSVGYEKHYDGHTVTQRDRNIKKFWKDFMAQDITFGSGIGRVRDAGYLAYTLAPETCTTRYKYPLYVDNQQFDNITELKKYVKTDNSMLLSSIYDKHDNIIGTVVPKWQHLYHTRPKVLPKKYQAIEKVYDWCVINMCHC